MGDAPAIGWTRNLSGGMQVSDRGPPENRFIGGRHGIADAERIEYEVAQRTVPALAGHQLDQPADDRERTVRVRPR